MWNWISKLAELKADGHPFALVTVTRCTGSTPRNTGAKMLVSARGELFGTVGGGYAEKKVIEDAKKCLTLGRSEVFTYPLYSSAGQLCGGAVEMLVEVMNQDPKVYIFGAGHVGKALAQTLNGTPFEIHLIDERPEWIDASDLPGEIHRHKKDWKAFVGQADWDPKQTFVVILTYTHEIDRVILEAILKHPHRYAGVIGSQTKWKAFEDKLAANGFSAEQIRNVHCPIGLDIGGKAPQEIAISIAAELLKVYHGK